MKKMYFVTLSLLAFGFQSLAQQTGSFNHQFSFMGQNRTLSVFVPTSYDSTQSYRLMIGLHGMGDNSNNYRNALINTLNWQNVFPQTIFVFPDGGTDQNRDFYVPPGDEVVIDSAMDFAMRNYSIDSNFVVLQGFSLGGRSATKYGLEHHAKFKGLLLNTPAMQGLRDIDNDSIASLVYDYANASEIPIYITVGESDLYFYLMPPFLKRLKKNNGIIHYEPVANFGHGVPSPNINRPAYPFFENPDSIDYDIDLFDINLVQHTCDAQIAPSFFVQNRGSTPVTSLDIQYQFAGNTGTYTWTGNMGSYEHAQLSLPSMATAQGKQVLELNIGTVNGNQTDTVAANNQLADTTEVYLQPDTLSLFEGFEGNTTGWVVNETGGLFGWFRDTDVQRTGTASIAAFNTILLFYTSGNVESFQSPLVDISSKPNAKITFDVAYNYHRYTAPYFVPDTNFTDTLEVVISTDCGQSWQSLYKKAGPDLATAANPILNPLNLQQVFFQPSASEWRTDTIDLAAYANESEAIIRFNYISALGGSIYIDNINIGEAKIGLSELQLNKLAVYPNPATDLVQISSDDKISSIHIYNTSGQKVLSQTTELKGSVEINVSSLPPGVYHLEVVSGSKSAFRNLLIRK